MLYKQEWCFSLVSTGAMFSMTLCFASTSQAPMMTAPIAPHGISQPATNHSAFISMALNIIIVKPVKTPPSRDEYIVNEQFARKPHEVHAPTGIRRMVTWATGFRQSRISSLKSPIP
jgi:hypothetical protein